MLSKSLQTVGYISSSLCRKLKSHQGRRAKLLYSWTLEMCWPTSKKSSSLKKTGRMPSQLFFQVGRGCLTSSEYTLFKMWSEIFMGRVWKNYILETFFAVGGGLAIVQKQPPVQKKLPWQQDRIAHNPLDSTSPLVKKGKQREVPKAKKHTPLKKVSRLQVVI